MTHVEILRYQMRLDHLFTKFDQLTGDAEIMAHWSRYLCVLLSGYLENAIRIIFREYTRGKSAPNVYNYVEHKLNEFQNPKMGRIMDLTASFNTHWFRELEESTDNEMKDVINSIVNIRNQVVHGQDAGITPATLRNYYREAQKFVQQLERQCHSR